MPTVTMRELKQNPQGVGDDVFDLGESRSGFRSRWDLSYQEAVEKVFKAWVTVEWQA